MRYAILIYMVDGVFESLAEEQQEAFMQIHRDIQASQAQKGDYAVARLMPVTNAVTVRDQGGPDRPPIVVDGPFAETKERFMGFYVVDCETIEEAIEIGKPLAAGYGAIEVRPVGWGGGVLSTEE